MNYLALDIGSKTLGLAISKSGIIANGYKTISFISNNYNEMYNKLKKEILNLKIDIIIIGNPKHMNNDEGIRSDISFMIKERLIKDFPKIKVELFDERLTTKESYLIMQKLNKKQKDKKKLKDTISAEIILQTYLNIKNE